MNQEATPFQPEPEAPLRAAQARRSYVQDDPRLRSPAVASLLSLLPGLGQVYVGYYQQGFLYCFITGSVIAIINADGLRALQPLLGIFLAFFWLFNMVDAGRKATMLNLGIHRMEQPEIPDGFGKMGVKGQVIGGLALIAIGTLVFAQMRFGFSLAWLENWWPIGLVAVGIILVWKAVRERK